MQHDGPTLDMEPLPGPTPERKRQDIPTLLGSAKRPSRLPDLLRPLSAPPVLDRSRVRPCFTMAFSKEPKKESAGRLDKSNIKPLTVKQDYNPFPLGQVGSFLYTHACGAQHEDAYLDKAKVPRVTTPASLLSNNEVDRRERYAQRCPPRLTEYNPPSNFGSVIDGRVFRSAYPVADNYPFLKRLGIKTILTLVTGPPTMEYVQFMALEGIEHLEVHIPANKGEVRVESSQIFKALRIALDTEKYPLLIHCNKGKHRTGCVVGALRKCQGWTMANMISEYHVYADPKARLWDEILLQFFCARRALSAVIKEGVPVGRIIPTRVLSESSENQNFSNNINGMDAEKAVENYTPELEYHLEEKMMQNGE